MRLPYAYIVATSFSGSTLLAILLDTHPELASIGEVSYPLLWSRYAARGEDYPCSCGAPMPACPFFAAVRARCRERGLDLDLSDFGTRAGTRLPALVRRYCFEENAESGFVQAARDALVRALPPLRRHVTTAVDRTAAVARAVLDVAGKRVFVDSTKGAAIVPHLAARPDLDLHVVHVVRDVRAVVWSHAKRGQENLAYVARSWARTHAAARRLRARVGDDRYTLVRWEDFCARPDESLGELQTRLGVAPAALTARVNDVEHHVIGNKMRLAPVGPIRADEEWRERLEPDVRTRVERAAGRLNATFGYD